MLLSLSQIPQMRPAPGAASMHIMLLRRSQILPLLLSLRWNAMGHVAARKPGWWPNATCLKKLTVDAPRLPEVSCGSKQLADSFADRIAVGSMAVVSKGPQERQLSTQRQCDLRTNLPAVSIHRRPRAKSGQTATVNWRWVATGRGVC